MNAEKWRKQTDAMRAKLFPPRKRTIREAMLMKPIPRTKDEEFDIEDAINVTINRVTSEKSKDKMTAMMKSITKARIDIEDWHRRGRP